MMSFSLKTFRVAIGSGLLAAFWAADNSVAVAADDEALKSAVVPCPEVGYAVNFKPLSEIRVDPRMHEQLLPSDCSESLMASSFQQGTDALNRTEWGMTVAAWESPNLFYRPLYFDNQPLERYGQTAGMFLQPPLSGAHFIADLATLPLQVLADHPCRLVSPAGFSRPGSPSPCIRERCLLFEIDPLWFHLGRCRFSRHE